MKSITFTFLLIILLTSSCTMNGKKAYKSAFLEEPYDVVIVPGSAYDLEPDKYMFTGKVYWAKLLLDQGIAKNIIFSGTAKITPYTESVAMKLYAEQIGVPAHKIIVEKSAGFDGEYIFNSLKVCQDNGFNRVAIATDIYQNKRLKKIIEEKELDIKLVPMNFSYTDYVPVDEYVFDDSEAFVKDFVPFHRRLNTDEKKERRKVENYNWASLDVGVNN